MNTQFTHAHASARTEKIFHSLSASWTSKHILFSEMSRDGHDMHLRVDEIHKTACRIFSCLAQHNKKDSFVTKVDASIQFPQDLFLCFLNCAPCRANDKFADFPCLNVWLLFKLDP